MMIPTVHLNGTSKQHLLDELHAAYAALGSAIATLRQVTVHGRDYYVQSPAAYTVARAEMDVRLAALDVVQDELRELYVGIQKQGKQPVSA